MHHLRAEKLGKPRKRQSYELTKPSPKSSRCLNGRFMSNSSQRKRERDTFDRTISRSAPYRLIKFILLPKLVMTRFIIISKDGSGVAANLRDGDRKRLAAYSAYAWGAPAAIVVTCVVIDHTEKGAIGYGEFFALLIC